MTTHEFNNDSNQAERRRVERDTYLSRAQTEADQVGGRFKKEITTTVNAVPTYPSLPASSPWAQGFDQNLEPELGFSVDEMPTALNPATVVGLPADAGDRAKEPVVGAVNSATALAAGSSIKRRAWS